MTLEYLLSFLDESGGHRDRGLPDVEVDRVRVAAVVDHGQRRVEGLTNVPRCPVKPGANVIKHFFLHYR
jgi:hypothetical protein